MKNLYQKHHGLPGIPQTHGQNGSDGKGGNNIYFGYISDFFNNMEITVDNFIRIAQKTNESGAYYTGIFDISTGIYADQDNYLNGESVSSKTTGGVTTITRTNNPKNNIFRQIYSDIYYEKYNYSYKGENDKMSWLYAKVDTNGTGIPQRWNVNLAPLWMTGEGSTGSSPYTSYDGTVVDYDYKPGKNKISIIDGFELFSITANNKNYTYSTDNGKYEDKRYTFGKTNSLEDKLSNPEGSGSMIEYFSELYLSGEKVQTYYDYVKYSHKAVETAIFTDKLKNDIKAGDVIYFYTDKESFELEHTVEYMVVITKELENCTINDLLEHATIVEPFSFKYLSTEVYGSEKYISTHNKAIAVMYPNLVPSEDDTATPSDYYKRNAFNFANMISYNNDSAFSVGKMVEMRSGVENNSTTLFFQTGNSNIFKCCSVYDNNEVTNKIVCSNGSKLPLKISNLMIKKNNVGNLETNAKTMPNNINFDNSGYCYTLTEDDYNFANQSFTVDVHKFGSDSDMFTYGAIVVAYDNNDKPSTFSSDNCIVKNYIFNENNHVINLKTDYLENTEYNILVWIADENGMRHYSKHTIAKYDEEIQNFSISSLEDNSDINTDDESYGDTTIFRCSGLSANATTDEDNITLDILVPSGSNISVYANTNEISQYYNYSNSWCTLSGYQKLDVSEGDFDVYRVNVSVNDNIPQLFSNNDKQTAREYNASPGISNESDGCDIFNALMKGSTIKTNSRSVTITVKYKNGSRDVKSYYKLTQPGYIDTRKVPKIDLNLNKGLDILERSNDINNGVLCNQMQFFVDIDISDFTREIWGSYVPEENITLNFDITNTVVDYEFVERYGIQSSEDMYTVHINPVDKNKDIENNFCAIKTYFVNNDIVDPYTKSIAELDKSHNDFVTLSESSISDNIRNSGDGASSIKTIGGRKINTIDSNIFKGEPHEATWGTGIDDNVVIQMRNITFKQASEGKYRFRVTVEFGNPLFAKLFFRYYVSNIWVSYKDNNGVVSNFYVGTTNLAKSSQTGRYQTYEYMYATDTFNAFVCPISLTAVPEEITVDNINNDVKLVGSKEQITLKVDKYVPELSDDIKEMTDNERLEHIVRNQYIPWYNFKLKKKYFQDNVKGMSIQPIHIKDIKDKISSTNLFNVIDGYDNIKSDESMKTYMSVVYNAAMYKQKMRDDKMTFYYNDELFNSSQFSQYSNNAPVFVEESITYDIRDSVLMNSIDVWNYEYQTKNSYNDGIFEGHLSTYGNGYIYLSDDADYNQYPDMLSLSETKIKNDEFVFTESYIDNAAQFANQSNMYPSTNNWFRTLLYQLKWQYPKYYTNDNQEDKVDAYDIINVGNYMETYDSTTNGKNEAEKYKLPYNIMYSLYPRCAYDNETDTTIFFMLRCPSVVKENKYALESSDIKYTHMKDDYDSNQLQNDNLSVVR